ncbi:MAG: hypothetical protein NTV07_01710 [Candidatus Omnitrophica bacterium]|nr:hypothetical protein [Candidatus Omnitrophota bacterium]
MRNRIVSLTAALIFTATTICWPAPDLCLRPLALLESVAQLQAEKENLQQELAADALGLEAAKKAAGEAVKKWKWDSDVLSIKKQKLVQPLAKLKEAEAAVAITKNTPATHDAALRAQKALTETIAPALAEIEVDEKAVKASETAKSTAIKARDDLEKRMAAKTARLKIIEERIPQLAASSQLAVSSTAIPLFEVDTGNLLYHSHFNAANGDSLALLWRMVQPGDTLTITEQYIRDPVREAVRKTTGQSKGDITLVVKAVMPTEKDGSNLVTFNTEGLIVRVSPPVFKLPTATDDPLATPADTLVRWGVNKYGLLPEPNEPRHHFSYGIFNKPGEDKFYNGAMRPTAIVDTREGTKTIVNPDNNLQVVWLGIGDKVEFPAPLGECTVIGVQGPNVTVQGPSGEHVTLSPDKLSRLASVIPRPAAIAAAAPAAVGLDAISKTAAAVLGNI